MPAETAQSAKTPWHLWVAGVISLLWNAMGALDFTMTQTHNEAYLKALTPEQLAFVYGFPLWSVIAWGMGTWGGFLGSLLVLCRQGFAVNLFAVSLAGVVLLNVFSYGLSDTLKIMHGGAGAVIFSAVIFLIAALLFVYARAMRRRGVLR
ncbi:MAG: hypothetical protein PSU94_16235 [Lacunisphaera sp.]|nr:hypothetical protein [Lacunisphaera sp.]